MTGDCISKFPTACTLKNHFIREGSNLSSEGSEPLTNKNAEIKLTSSWTQSWKTLLQSEDLQESGDANNI